MTATPRPDTTAPHGAHALPEADRALLNRLRLSALRCRAASRTDLFQACALLGTDPEAGAPAFAEALVRTLDQGLGRRPILYRPGAADLSFDERWLISLVAALRRGDEASATFLLNSRLVHGARRSLGFLAARLARLMWEENDDPKERTHHG
ncbi:hypothetical protein SAMN04490244_101167 [Tranquillimonas rosea]|uniref:Uncharacterized protein n=1 Tax=Tranquillimonas rosea TaxID=641238 RepID=A0A1H9PG94_9RHOB|nr:hypothetical protein [Tranquillimonas rosea]SER47174.1 hypothetical protein SAMN04490244_101167 [Tranquillimonas rosea]